MPERNEEPIAFNLFRNICISLSSSEVVPGHLPFGHQEEQVAANCTFLQTPGRLLFDWLDFI